MSSADTLAAVHDVAQKGFGTKDAADRYDAYRPSYTAETVECVLRPVLSQAAVKTGSELRMLDLAAGTGAFTRALVKEYQKTAPGPKLALTCVEPMDAFREKLAGEFKVLSVPVTESAGSDAKTDAAVDAKWSQLAGPVVVLPGSATKIPLPDHSQHIVTVAQAFHWFANKEALQEIHRVLVPGGFLVLLWNKLMTSIPWVEETKRQFDKEIPNMPPQHSTGKWKLAPFAEAGFADVVSNTVPSQVFRVPVDSILLFSHSQSYVTSLPADERATVLEQMRQLVTKHSVGTAEDGTVLAELGFTPEVHWLEAK